MLVKHLELGHTITYNLAQAACAELPGQYKLCMGSEVCPEGDITAGPAHAAIAGEHWAPISDEPNDWIALGDTNGRTCWSHNGPVHAGLKNAAMNGEPAWGSSAEPSPHKNHVYCCREPSDRMLEIDPEGGRWTLVRHAPAVDSLLKESSWHLAMDRLAGSDAYADGDERTPTTYDSPYHWSKKFDDIPFDEFLFATGDGKMWLIAKKESVIGEYYEASPREVVKSSLYPNGPSQVKWANREKEEGDPMVTLTDVDDAGRTGGVLYRGSRTLASRWLKIHGGANVYIRKRRTCPFGKRCPEEDLVEKSSNEVDGKNVTILVNNEQAEKSAKKGRRKKVAKSGRRKFRRPAVDMYEAPPDPAVTVGGQPLPLSRVRGDDKLLDAMSDDEYQRFMNVKHNQREWDRVLPRLPYKANGRPARARGQGSPPQKDQEFRWSPAPKDEEEEEPERQAAAERPTAQETQALIAEASRAIDGGAQVPRRSRSADGPVRAAASKACPRAPGYWCTHAGATYTDTVDCDGDGIPDPQCSDPTGAVGFIGSASSCASNWPNGVCQAAKASQNSGILADDLHSIIMDGGFMNPVAAAQPPPIAVQAGEAIAGAP